MWRIIDPLLERLRDLDLLRNWWWYAIILFFVIGFFAAACNSYRAFDVGARCAKYGFPDSKHYGFSDDESYCIRRVNQTDEVISLKDLESER